MNIMLYADKIKSLLNFNLLSILFIYVSFARRMEKNLTPNFVFFVIKLIIMSRRRSNTLTREALEPDHSDSLEHCESEDVPLVHVVFRKSCGIAKSS
jgi:hypothetical protein